MSQLKKEISSFGLLMTSLSAMIGSGWLLSSMVAAKLAGPAAVLSWLIGGIMIAFIAVCFSELSTAFPVAGGIARYGQFSHGKCISFIISWLAWLSCVAVAPTESIAILQYASRFFDGLTYQVNDTFLLTNLGLTYAAVLVFIMAWINQKGIKMMIRYNNILTIWKICVPLFVLTVLAYHQFIPSNFTDQSFMPSGMNGVLSALSTTVIFSFLGFRECTSLAEEVKNPQRSIPIAAIGSVLYCTVFYVIMQSVFIASMNPDAFSLGWGALSFDFDAGPFAGLALMLGLKWLATIIYIDAIIAPMGAGLVYTATTSRLLLAISKNGFLPPALQKLNKNQVPQFALIVNGLVGLALLAPFEDWVALVRFQSVAIVVAYAIGPIALLALRTTAPKLKRPFKLPYAYFFSTVTLYICFLLIHWSSWENVLAIIISCLAGLFIYFLHSGTEDMQHAKWFMIILTTCGITGYFGTFGGIEALNIWQESLILLIGSILAMYFGVKQRINTDQYTKYIEDKETNYYDAI
ncbi:APC family permease [Candidatus Comchoanobacter bicostacola]|uniref:APC family permease n=1 Tax=Candidatus Comchoanobacter bicostacola TaxID=2919598 RepID=A0ABY5DMZ8_9GAMM|nr:APC family permease [Candidatus Comchoanobacter bicostacola]UTC24986.1 APC family permease [Candidatus Comchoanobacter bicostacola]